MRGPRSSNDGSRVGGGPSSSAPTWTPARLIASAGLQFFADFSRANTITTATGISQLTDAAGGSVVLAQATGSKQPTIVNSGAGLLAGRASALFVNASAQELRANLGGLATPTADHWEATICRFTAGTAFRAMISYGQPNGASCLGEGNTTQYWAGRSGGVTPVGGTIDTTAAHLLLKTRVGNVTSLYVDGQLVATVTDASYSVSAGLGFTGHAAGSEPGGNAWVGLWGNGALSAADRRRVEAWAIGRGVAMADAIACCGDSLTVIGGYPAQLATYLPGWKYTLNTHGTGGNTSAQILAAIMSDGTLSATQANGWQNTLAVVDAGTNDAFQHISTVTTAANLASIKSALEGAGYTVVWQTVAAWTPGTGWDAGAITSAAATNAWVIANVSASQIAHVDTMPEMALTGGGTTFDGVYRLDSGVNAGHWTTAGAGAVAALVAGVLLGLRR